MSRVPSFNNPQKLREAATPIVSDIRGPMSPHIEATIQLVIKYFMSGVAQGQAHRIRSARQFKAVVTTLIREVDKKIEELLGVALQVARRRYRGQNAQVASNGPHRG